MYNSDKLQVITVIEKIGPYVLLNDNDNESVIIGGKDEILLLIKDLQKVLKEKFDYTPSISYLDIYPYTENELSKYSRQQLNKALEKVAIKYQEVFKRLADKESQ